MVLNLIILSETYFIDACVFQPFDGLNEVQQEGFLTINDDEDEVILY